MTLIQLIETIFENVAIGIFFETESKYVQVNQGIAVIFNIWANWLGESTKSVDPVDRVYQNMDRVHGLPFMDRVHWPSIFASPKIIVTRLWVCSMPGIYLTW